MEIPSNAVTTLRVLTKKSRLGFGKFADLTVADILIVEPEYIVWVYATMEAISFNDEILDEYHIPKIAKPGTDERLVFKWRDICGEGMTEEQRMHGAIKRKRGAKAFAYARLCAVRSATSFSRGQLQAINHGKMKK